MTHFSPRASTATVIRFGRTMQLSWGMALGISLTLGLNVFILTGWLARTAGSSLRPAYLLALLLLVPILLTYVERSSARRNSHSVFELVQANSSNSRRFITGWLLLLGYVALAGLLSWGAGLTLSILAQSLFRVALATRWMAGLAVFAVALYHIMGVGDTWSIRTKIVYASLLLVLIIAGWSLITPTNDAFRFSEPDTPLDLSRVVAFLAVNLWGVALILGHKVNVHRPHRVLIPSLVAPFVLGALLGILVSAIKNFPLAWASSPNSPGQLIPRLASGSMEIVFVIAGLIISVIVLQRVIANAVQLLASMAHNGFLPRGFGQDLRRPEPPKSNLAAFAAATALMVMFVPLDLITGLASLAFLWVTVLLNAPDVIQFHSNKDNRQGVRLPFHPVFPGLAAAVGLFLPFALPTIVLIAGGVWTGLGVVYYLTKVQKRSVEARQQFIFRESPSAPMANAYTVLVAIMNPETAVALIQAGALLARARNGNLIVLHVLDQQEEFTRNISYLHPEKQLHTVEHFVQQANLPPDVPVTSFVRVARTTKQGIVETVKDEQVDLLLIGWEETYRNQHPPSIWEQSLLRLRALQDPAGIPRDKLASSKNGDDNPLESMEVVDLNPMLDKIVQAVTCDVAVLRGKLPKHIRRVLIPASGRSSVTTALELGQALVKDDHGKVVALHVVPDALFSDGESVDVTETGPRDNPSANDEAASTAEPAPQPALALAPQNGTAALATPLKAPAGPTMSDGEGTEQATSPSTPQNESKTGSGQFHALFDEQTADANVEQKVVRASSVISGILDIASSYDVVLMNASRLIFLDTHFFNGIPAEVALSRRQPTILVRPYEAKHHRWLRNRWQSLAAIFPKTSVAERADISIAMRQAAQPSIDFFVLIVLSATIATFGLLQNSGAVIIGAMLVAPLMSPIASMAMGVVEGSAQLVRVAAEATIKGVVLAISVGVAVTLLSPATQITDQILARTQPTLLDLAIALASGAAAGYALSRKQVAAALPGVSIAVALVPPLCVVGYGIATSRYTVAGGALLLFATNLVAIVLAAGTFFLLLGFRPPTTRQAEQFQQGLRLSLLSLALIAIPLAVLLHISLRQLDQQEQLANMQQQVETILTETIPRKTARFINVEVEPDEEDGYVIHAIVYDYTGLDLAQLGRVEDEINLELGVPVRLQATLLRAQLTGRKGDEAVPVPPSESAPAPPTETPTSETEQAQSDTAQEPSATPAQVAPIKPTEVVK